MQLLKKRNWVSSICELLLPLGFTAIMIGIYYNFDTNVFDNTQYTGGDVAQVMPFGVVPFRLRLANQRLALVAGSPAMEAVIDKFIADMDERYPAFNGSAVGGVGFNNPLLRNIYLPKFSSCITRFPSESALEAAITGADYGTFGDDPSHPKVWGAVVFYASPLANGGGGAQQWDYSIRMNASEIYSTSQPKVDVLQRGYDANAIKKYIYSTPPTNGGILGRTSTVSNPVLAQTFPGFMSLQLTIDRWIINATVDGHAFDGQAALQMWGVSMTAVLTPLQMYQLSSELAYWQRFNSSQPQYYQFLAIASDIGQWVAASERYAPQGVNVVPFPITGYQYNNFYSTVLPVFAFFFVITFLFPVSRLIRGIVMEKEMKIREGMRMMGMTEAALAGSWFITYAILYCVLALLVAAFTSTNIFKYTPFGMVWLLFFLFGLSSTTFCYLISVFFSRAKTASTVGIVLFLGGYFPFFALQPVEISMGAKAAGALLCPTAFGLALDLMGNFESNGAGVHPYNAGAVVNNWSFSSSIALLIWDTIMYSLLAWYLDNTLPASFREFGIPRPLSFPFTLSYWREVLNLPPQPAGDAAPLIASGGSSSKGSSARRLLCCGRRSAAAPADCGGGRRHNGPPTDPSYLEEPDTHLRAKEAAGRLVSIRRLRKEFATPDGIKVAVDDVDMTMYEGQIFVLLGHNGAGKTTTISMMTGLIPATDGGATVFGRDIGSQLDQVRKELGVCPQHDVLWPELTVEEHLRIFAEIKEVPKDAVEKEIAKAVADVGLTEKRRYQSRTLSGGQKRKLSVCIALVGGSRVVFLDEPTSGMDPYSRRSTWQILQNAREGRVIVLTTHFMDEADILGDRIAIMANGQVKCCGSPMFLKQKYGVGYILTLVKAQGQHCDADAVVSFVKQYVPEVAIGTNVAGELSLRLPLTSSPAFPALLSAMDANLAHLAIASYGVSVSDIQDVFLKVAEGSHHAAPVEGAGASAGGGGGTAGDAAASAVVPVGVKDEAQVHSFANPMPGAGTGSQSPTDKGGATSLDAVRAEARAVQTGWATFARHFKALFLKRLQFTRRDYKALIYQLFIPVVMTLGGLALLKAGMPTAFPDYQFSTAQFNAATSSSRRPGVSSSGDPNKPIYPNYVPYMTYKSTGDAYREDAGGIGGLMGSFQAGNVTTDPRMTFGAASVSQLDAADASTYQFVTSSSYPTRDYQRMSSFLLRDKPTYQGSKYGAYLLTRDGSLMPAQNTSTTLPASNAVTYSLFSNTTAKHGSPIFANLMHTAMLRARSGDTGASITARTHPLPYTQRQANLISAFFAFSAAIIIVMAYAFIPASYAIFVVKEREVSAKHQQLISGVSIPAYWLSTFVWDSITYILPAGLSIILCKLFDITDFTSTDQHRIGALILLFWLYGMSVAPFTYMLTYLFKSHSTAQNVVLFINVTCMILMVASLVMSQIESTCRADEALRFVYRLLPGYSLGNGLISLSFLNQLAIIDSSCDRNHGIIRPASSYVQYDALDLKATGYNLIYMAVETVVYFLITIVIDIGMSHPQVRLWFKTDPVVADTTINEDEDVAAERQKVAAQVTAMTGASFPPGDADVILVNNLRKVFAAPTGSGGKVAVRGMSFGIPSGQVFGFLGINGAGKTTTLQMLSGDVLPSAGSAMLAGYDIIKQQPQVRRLLGYCPQWDALLELLTVKEHLELYARIKGVPEKQVPSIVQSQMEQFDLLPFTNKTAGSLSGGNKRKLSVAIALIGSPPIVFLDEPSTGMDPVAKRFMWQVISRVATERKLCSIILTTHSMEEVEALCTRIGIMVGGRLRCLGTAQHLKNRHGSGFMAEIKLQPPSAEQVDSFETAMAMAITSSAGANQHQQPRLSGYITRAQVAVVSGAMGNSGRGAEVHETGTGWSVHQLFVNSIHPSPHSQPQDKAIPLRDFATWWAEEQLAKELVVFMCNVAFQGAELLERHGSKLLFRIPPQSERLSSVFARLESARVNCNIQSYALSQTSLEQIFNSFAAQQDEEKGVARGMLQVAVHNEQGHAAADALAATSISPFGDALVTSPPVASVSGVVAEATISGPAAASESDPSGEDTKGQSSVAHYIGNHV